MRLICLDAVLLTAPSSAAAETLFRRNSIGELGPMPHLIDLVSGVVGGGVASFALHPLDLIKIRLQVADSVHHEVKYKSTVHAFRTIVATEGVRGLFKGAVPGVFHVMLSSSRAVGPCQWRLGRCVQV